MNKKELIADIAGKLETTKKNAEPVLNCVLSSIVNGLTNEGEVQIAHFGKFEVKTRVARTGVNPVTGEKIDIPETKVVKFKPAKALKEKFK